MLRPSLLITTLIIAFQTTEAQTPSANQYTFARLYGYVRYFHPSDANVVTDWNTLAIYGAKAVDKAKNTSELKAALEEVFLPIAPTLRIFETGKSPQSPFVMPKEAAGMKVVTWQHNGYGASGISTNPSGLTVTTSYPKARARPAHRSAISPPI